MKVKMSFWLPADLARWLRIAAASRGISRSDLVREWAEAAQQKEDPS